MYHEEIRGLKIFIQGIKAKQAIVKLCFERVQSGEVVNGTLFIMKVVKVGWNRRNRLYASQKPQPWKRASVCNYYIDQMGVCQD